jgi:predicted dehydrogenase
MRDDRLRLRRISNEKGSTMNQTSISPLRIGILGCANIARQFTAAVAPGRWACIEAVGSRDTDTAAAFAAECGITRHYGS